MTSQENRIFEFSQEQITDIFADCWESADDFIEGFCTDPDRDLSGIKIKVNPRRLFLAIQSAYQDIARFKNYHQSDPWAGKLDCTKRCAYLIKWIPKFRPIQILRIDEQDITPLDRELDELELINEIFAIYVFDLHLSNEIELDVIMKEQKIKDYAYDILYREVTKDGWISILNMLKECCSPEFIPDNPFLDIL